MKKKSATYLCIGAAVLVLGAVLYTRSKNSETKSSASGVDPQPGGHGWRWWRRRRYNAGNGRPLWP